MKVMIMHLITSVSGLASHPTHANIKVREETHALWLNAGDVPALKVDRSGSGDGGEFVIFYLVMISEWLDFLLDNMFVEFGYELISLQDGRTLEPPYRKQLCLQSCKLFHGCI